MKLNRLLTCLSVVVGMALMTSALAQPADYAGTYTQSMNQSQFGSAKIGIVSTRKCAEDSKLGQQEQANFKKMTEQMEAVLQDKERDLEEMEEKLSDEDYMDSISEEASAELRRKRRNIRQDGMQLRNQYLQTLQKINLDSMQKLAEAISKASELVAQDRNNGEGFDIILNDEACTFYNPQLDITDHVVAKMNAMFEAEPKKQQPQQPLR